MVHGVQIVSDQSTFCSTIINFPIFSVEMCGVCFILAMTFDRFFSILRPHRAAMYNTVRRAKITCVIIIIISFLFNIPHLYVSTAEDTKCTPFGKAINTVLGQIYYWLSVVVNNLFPFVALLTMNGRIIYAIRKRVQKQRLNWVQGDNIDGLQIHSTDRQLSMILLSVTFSFLILTTPGYSLFFYVMFTNVRSTPRVYAQFHLFWTVSQKAYFTNNGINFLLYVIPGRRFRSQFLKLFVSAKSKKKIIVHSNGRTTNSATSV